MVKTLLGFATGVTLTTLVFLLLGEDQNPVFAPANERAGEAGSDSNPFEPFDNSRGSAGGAAVAEKQVLEQITPTELKGSVRVDLLSERERLENQLEEANQAALEANTARAEASRALSEFNFAELVAEPVLTYLPLASEFDFLNSSGWIHFRSNHERIQREQRDERWAAPTEQQLWNFLNDRQEFMLTYGAPTITCVETLCEITLVSYGVPAELAYADFADLRRELMGDAYYKDSFELSPQWAESAEDDTAALFVILSRRVESSQTQSRIASALN